MQLRVLGAHNLESKDTRMESHLLDGVLALDAGSLTSALTFEEQMGVRAILLTHRHFDHVRDLLPLGLARMRESRATLDVFAIQDTADVVSSKLLDGTIYPNFLEMPSRESPTFRLNVVEFYQEFEVLDYKVLAVPVPHSVPAAGFQISSGGSSLFYTGDTGAGLSEVWKHVSPDALLTEVTMGNDGEAKARETGHLTPALLGDALTSFRELRGSPLRTIVSHLDPAWEATVRKELEALSSELACEIQVSHADMIVQI